MSKEISHEELKELQIKILDHIDDFCRKYQIRYSLSSGTLLGAVRHGGYIPWDDDIDIMMLREDYEKFTRCYKNENQVEYYQLLDHHVNNDYYGLFMKIHDTRTSVNESWQYSGLGIYIDIFPIDKIPCNQFAARLQYWIITFLNAIIISRKSQKKARTLWKRIIVNILSMLPVDTAWNLLNRLYNRNSRSEKSSGAANLTFWKFRQKRVPYEVFTELADIKFEDRIYKTIKNYDAYLSSVFGDYMTPPSDAEKRKWIHTISPTWK